MHLTTCVSVSIQSLSRVRFFLTPWTSARQAPLSMGLSRQEYWSGLPFPSPGLLPTQRSNPRLQHGQADSLPLCHLGSFWFYCRLFNVAENCETGLKVNFSHSFVHSTRSLQMISVEVWRHEEVSCWHGLFLYPCDSVTPSLLVFQRCLPHILPSRDGRPGLCQRYGGVQEAHKHLGGRKDRR